MMFSQRRSLVRHVQSLNAQERMESNFNELRAILGGRRTNGCSSSIYERDGQPNARTWTYPRRRKEVPRPTRYELVLQCVPVGISQKSLQLAKSHVET